MSRFAILIFAIAVICPSTMAVGYVPTKCLYALVKKVPSCGIYDIGDWYWDPATYQCVAGVYTGCGTGGYGYRTMEQCHDECAPTPPRYFATKSANLICNLPAEPGTSDCEHGQLAAAYFYDVTTGYCKQFIHRGCDLNSNNFPTLEECKQQCYVGCRSQYQKDEKLAFARSFDYNEFQ